jgi:type I restriction enzyme R subunit
MNNIGKLERETQNRVIQLFQKELGYEYLGNWEERDHNSNVGKLLYFLPSSVML